LLGGGELGFEFIEDALYLGLDPIAEHNRPPIRLEGRGEFNQVGCAGTGSAAGKAT